MLVYRGKLNWLKYAVNEAFTVIFHGPELKVGEPAIAVWQWTVDAKDVKKENVFYKGVIDSIVVMETGERQIYSHKNNYYHFQTIFSHDMKSCTVVMSKSDGHKSAPTILSLNYNTPLTAGIVPRYFVGKMDWLTYAIDEMYLVIIPAGDGVGSDIISYWEWTVDAKGREKTNAGVKDIIRTQEQSTDGEVISFGDDAATYYTFTGTISTDGRTCTVNMTKASGATGGPFVLTLQA